MLNKHFREFTGLLEKNKVRYLIVGGYAVGLHGFPRYTRDLDVFIAISKENARFLQQSFGDFGSTDLGLSEDDFLEEEIVIEIGREPLKMSRPYPSIKVSTSFSTSATVIRRRSYRRKISPLLPVKTKVVDPILCPKCKASE